jgi:hypothetical protein
MMRNGLLCLCVAALAACGSTPSTGDAGAGGGAAGAGGGAAGAGGGAAGAGGGAAGAGGGAAGAGGGAAGTGGGAAGTGGGAAGAGGGTVFKQGSITLNQIVIPFFSSSTVTAVFTTATTTTAIVDAGVSGCTQRTVGSCSSTVCRATDAGTPQSQDAGGSFSFDSAGLLTVSGLVDGGTLQLALGDGGFYTRTETAQLWNAGAMIRVSASGATVPAFMSPPLAAPDSITLTAPMCTIGQCGNVVRTMPLALSWSGGTTGDLDLNIFATGGGTSGSASVRCTFAASTGTGMVPATLLGDLPAGMGVLSLSSNRNVNFSAGAYMMNFTFVSAGSAGGLLTLQ